MTGYPVPARPVAARIPDNPDQLERLVESRFAVRTHVALILAVAFAAVAGHRFPEARTLFDVVQRL